MVQKAKLSRFHTDKLPMKFSILILLFILSSCGNVAEESSQSTKQTSAHLRVFYGSMTKMKVGVFYEPGAEPYTSDFIFGKKAWDVLEDNMSSLYDQRPQVVSYEIPKSLGEMNQMVAQNRATWDSASLRSLASSLGFGNSSGANGEFTLLFVKGTFQGNNNIIGVSITGTTTIAIFKDVVKAITSGETQDTKTYTEQFTIVHEMGHALGLVNNGVDIRSDHHDAAHGAHCSNSDCVMNWVNEGGKEILDFAARFILSGRNTAFGSQCLDDVKHYNP
ncbi:MAG: putative Zn-dependent protease [Bacteriovoracaceae bacterium]|jgi:predicted Zn-dependent protease